MQSAEDPENLSVLFVDSKETARRTGRHGFVRTYVLTGGDRPVEFTTTLAAAGDAVQLRPARHTGGGQLVLPPRRSQHEVLKSIENKKTGHARGGGTQGRGQCMKSKHELFTIQAHI